MRLSIEHETHYRFDEPANHSIQYLRLTPRFDACQSTVSWSVATPGKLTAWVDGFGNRAHVSVQDGPHDEVPVVVRGVVETFDTSGVLGEDDGLPPPMFLRQTETTRVEAGIAAFAAPFRERLDDEGGIAALHGLTAALNEAVTYRPGQTDVGTRAADALARGVGVCQDHAHLFIACCLELGVPARYVSGYVLVRDDGEQHLASHAWAEAHVDGLGWISFDVSNGQSATDAYVRLAVAHDYAGACPVRGVRKGGGTEALTVRVQVGQAQA